MKNDNARKKHLWILLGVVVPFALLAGVTVHAKEDDKLDPPAKEIDWKKTWEQQKFLFVWPRNSKLLSQFDRMNYKFGDPLPTDQGEFDEFMKPEVYRSEFSSLKKDSVGPGTGMADKVAPTQFKGGWQNVLRHVNDWGQRRITKDQVWLVMEDIWVQRAMLDTVRSVNEEIAAFRRARKDAGGNIVVDPSFNERGKKVDPTGKLIATPDAEKLDTLFRSRTWAVELKVKRDGAQARLTGTLYNLSDRLQLLGVGDMMTLKVWFTHNASEQPMIFRIGGSYLRGRGATKKENGVDVPDNSREILELEEHILPTGNNATEITRVEQVLDVRTVPIKRIDKLVLGNKAALDSRNADRALKSPSFIKEEEAPPPGPPPAPGGPAGPGGVGPQASDGVMGGGSVTAVIDGNKKRYLEVTPQVRLLPVGVVVLVDQSYVQDVLLAFANSPLRFQITQVEFQRYYGTLAGASNSNQPGNDIVLGFGNNNITGAGDPDVPLRPNLPPRIGPGPIGPGPIGPGPIGPGPGPNPFHGGPNSSTIPDTQVTSGLVELSVYGVVSLYEKPGDLVVKPIVAGREDRFNWPRWCEVFIAALPRPGTDGNLNLTKLDPSVNETIPPFSQVELWKGEGGAGEDALKWFKARMQKGVPIEAAIADARSEHPKALAMVNVETVHTRWVNDANAFLQAADAQVQGKFNVAIADWMLDAEREKDEGNGGRWKPKGPAEGGWVIEIRGWTDHAGGRAFINRSLLRNLQRTDYFAQQTNKEGGKVGKYLVGTQDPVKGKVSHAFVYNVFAPIHDPQPGTFYNINRGSFLDGLVEPTLTTPKPKGAALAPAWSPLNGGKAAGAGGVMPPRKEDSTRRRYEFVVMMVWREPTSTPAAAPPGL